MGQGMRDPRRTVRRLGTLLLVPVLLIVPSAPAGSHETHVRYRDPRGDGQADVWWSSKAKIHVTSTDHRQRFKVAGLLGPDWSVRVFVDSRGGSRADFKLWAFEDLGTSGCGGRRLFGAAIAVRCDRVMPVVGKWRLWWGMRRGVLRPTKPISWRVITDYPGSPIPGVPERDRAPNAGWYV
jgi:hypothetical protein